MIDNNYINEKVNVIIDKLQNKFDITMAYFYDKTNDIHLIYHNNSEIDFQDKFIDSSMDLLDDFFYNYNFNNIVINYNKSVYDVLIEKSFIEEQVSNYSNDNTDNYSFKNEKDKKLIKENI